MLKYSVYVTKGTEGFNPLMLDIAYMQHCVYELVSTAILNIFLFFRKNVASSVNLQLIGWYPVHKFEFCKLLVVVPQGYQGSLAGSVLAY